MEEINHEYTDEIVCPYCGYEFSDSWDFNRDSEEIDCPECEKTFEYFREVEVKYVTKKVESDASV